MLKNPKIITIAIFILAAILRLYGLGQNPPSLYWDEVSLGYNAYSILKSGSDEHGKKFPITNFAAFGDYKPPLYIYLTTPSIAVFGLNEFAVRLPSALFGTLTVIVTYFLAKKLFSKQIIVMLATFLLAISPWHIQHSRAAFEGNVGLFFSTLGIYLFIKFAKDNAIYLFPALLSFLAAMYTFTGQRLFVPLILLVLIWIFKDKIYLNIKTGLVAFFLSALIFYPLFNFSSRTLEGKLRFEEVTIFKNLDPIKESTHFRDADNDLWFFNLLHNRRVFFAKEFIKNYFDAFDPEFLFVRGDGNPRLSIQDVGELYYFELPMLIAGTYFLFRKNNKYRALIFAWLLISPLGPATARETPHALRMIHILPTFQLIGGYGLYGILSNLKPKRFFLIVLALIIAGSIYHYLHQYYFHYPKQYSGEWQYGYKEAVEVANSYYSKVDRIVVTEKFGRPYIYFLFFGKVEPQEFLGNSNVVKDDLFFYHVNGFDKYIFSDNYQGDDEKNTLYIVQSGGLPDVSTKIKTINDLQGNPVFDIGLEN